MSSTRSDILERMAEDIQDSNVFKAYFRSFTNKELNLTNLGQMRLPLLAIIDTGTETAEVTDEYGSRFAVQVFLHAIVKTNQLDIITAINNTMSAIKNLIASDPLTHTAVRKWQYVSSESITIGDEGVPMYAQCAVETRLIYYANHGSY